MKHTLFALGTAFLSATCYAGTIDTNDLMLTLDDLMLTFTNSKAAPDSRRNVFLQCPTSERSRAFFCWPDY